jgi:hypothetical protein
LAAACTGSDSGGPTTGPSGCQAACAVCGSDFCIDCAATSAKYRDEFETPLYACVQEGGDGSCSSLWESCAIRAATQTPRRSIDDAYREACLVKRTQCIAEGTTFADDDCLISIIMEESVVMQAQDCLSKACPDLASCLRAIFK